MTSSVGRSQVSRVAEDAAPDTVLGRARALHDGHVVLDALFVPLANDVLIERLRAGGVTTVHATVALHETFRGMVDWLLRWDEAFAAHPDALMRVTSVHEILLARAEGRIGVLFGVQNASPVEDDLRLLRPIRELGVRIIQLTYNERNLVGDGCAEPSDAGLSAFGRQFVSEMNRQHLLIDISHAGERTALEAIELSADAVVATHSNARALCDHPRNLSDRTIRAIGAKGGVVGINAFPGFVSHRPGTEQTVEDVVDHVAYIGDIIGRDRVGIGLDLDEPDTPSAQYTTPDGVMGVGRYPFPHGFVPPWPWVYPVPSIAAYPRITEALIRRGFADVEVAGVIGGNFLRVFEQVWGA